MNKKSIVVVALTLIILLFILLAAGRETDQAGLGVIEDVPAAEVEQSPESEPAVEPMQQMKIDVRVACESALMYTTFTDGASAEAFVADCVDGKHPEVIERYINDMGVDGALI